jgi:ADP-ribose pyrophosphatase
MTRPKLIASDLVYNGYFHVKKDLLMREDGETLPYTHFCLLSDAVVILAFTPEGLLVLNREYRHPTGGHILGLPGGRLEQDEDPITGGTRELLEETGYASDDITLLGHAYPMPAMCNQKVYYLLAKNARKQSLQKLDPFEYIRPELKSEEELKKELAAGAPIDGHLLTALSMHRLA